MPIYILWKNVDSIYLGCNQVTATIAGCNSPEEMIKKSDYDFWKHDQDADQYIKEDKEVVINNLLLFNLNDQPANNKLYCWEQKYLIMIVKRFSQFSHAF